VVMPSWSSHHATSHQLKDDSELNLKYLWLKSNIEKWNFIFDKSWHASCCPCYSFWRKSIEQVNQYFILLRFLFYKIEFYCLGLGVYLQYAKFNFRR
jgi:hypothetical protein